MTKGHSLVIPKKHYRWVYDVPEFDKYWLTVLAITKAIQRSLKPIWITYFTHGYVSHAHIHILPRYEEVMVSTNLPMREQTISEGEMNEITKNIYEQTKKLK